jgi:Spy/CpxP family protein refolding chaperone
VSALHPRFSYPAAAFALALLVAVPTGGTALHSATQAGARPTASGQTQVQTPAPVPTGQRPAGASRPFEWEWWKDADVQKALALSESKVKNISRIFDERARRVRPTLEKYETERAELDRLASERKISVEEFTLHVTQVEALRSELNKSRTIMNYRILRELTPEQNQKLKEIADQRWNPRTGRGGGRGAQPHR